MEKGRGGGHVEEEEASHGGHGRGKRGCFVDKVGCPRKTYADDPYSLKMKSRTRTTTTIEEEKQSR
jgi:hypothetical protein